MLDDAFKITLDCIYPPNPDFKKKKDDDTVEEPPHEKKIF